MTMNKMFGPLAGILGSPKNSDLVGWGGVPTRESLLRARESFTGWDRLGVELGWGARRSAAVTDRRGWRPGGERSFSFPDEPAAAQDAAVDARVHVADHIRLHPVSPPSAALSRGGASLPSCTQPRP